MPEAPAPFGLLLAGAAPALPRAPWSLRRRMLPAAAVSLVLHAVLLAALLLGLSRQKRVVEAGDTPATVELVMSPPGNADTNAPATAPPQPEPAKPKPQPRQQAASTPKPVAVEAKPDTGPPAKVATPTAAPAPPPTAAAQATPPAVPVPAPPPESTAPPAPAAQSQPAPLAPNAEALPLPPAPPPVAQAPAAPPVTTPPVTTPPVTTPPVATQPVLTPPVAAPPVAQAAPASTDAVPPEADQSPPAQSVMRMPDAAKPDTAPPAATPPAQIAPQFNFGGIASDTNALVTGSLIVPPGVDPTFRNRKPNYPPEAARRGEQGAVVLIVHVSPEGLVNDVDIAQSSGFRLLDQSAEDTVLTWHFLPAMRNGRPIPFTMPLRIMFSLD